MKELLEGVTSLLFKRENNMFDVLCISMILINLDKLDILQVTGICILGMAISIAGSHLLNKLAKDDESRS
jgi:hypothetical protein